MTTELTNEQRERWLAQADTILQGNPTAPALYRLLTPGPRRDELERDQVTREKICDNQHEANRPVCRVRR